jgi:hypothetical protein
MVTVAYLIEELLEIGFCLFAMRHVKDLLNAIVELLDGDSATTHLSVDLEDGFEVVGFAEYLLQIVGCDECALLEITDLLSQHLFGFDYGCYWY